VARSLRPGSRTLNSIEPRNDSGSCSHQITGSCSYGTDVIYYGSDLLDWFEHEFQKSKRPIGPIHRRLPFWTSLVDMEWSDPDTE